MNVISRAPIIVPTVEELFRSDWSTAGTSVPSQANGDLRDTNKAKPWTTIFNNSFNDLTVVDAAGVGGFPSAMKNVLRVRHENPTVHAAEVVVQSGWPRLSVGDYLFLQYYLRVAFGDDWETFGANHHFVEGDNSDHGGGDNEIRSHWLSKGGNADDGTWGPFWLAENTGSPDNNWYINTAPDFPGPSVGKQVTTRLNKSLGYRVTLRFHIVSTTKFGVAMRLYDPTDDTTVLYPDGATGLTKLVNGQGTNITTFGENFIMRTGSFSNSMDWWSTWAVGNNGGDDPASTCYKYFGGVRVRKDRTGLSWPGPYTTMTG